MGESRSLLPPLLGKFRFELGAAFSPIEERKMKEGRKGRKEERKEGVDPKG